MKKKLFVILLSLVMVVTMMPLSVFADTANTSDKESAAEEIDNSATAEETKVTDPSTDYLSFTALYDDVEISMSSQDLTRPDVSYEYSTDKSLWEDFAPGKTTITVIKYQTVYIRAKNDGQDFPCISDDCKWKFSISGHVNAGGNIMSLVSKDCSETKMKDNGFQNLFSGCSNLITPPKLPATILASNCYKGMFWYCDRLKETPELPAEKMEYGCYESMFEGCKRITASSKFSAKELAENCFARMFFRCDNLSEPPILSAKKLAKNCYTEMFYECPNLTKAPYLPAENLEEGCYAGMFEGCTKLKYVSVMFTDWKELAYSHCPTDEWLKNTERKGVFVCPEELDVTIKDSTHIPNGWTVERPTPPEPPVIPTITTFKAKAIDSKTCQLNWDELKQFEDVKYEIYRGTTPTGYWPKIGETSNNSYTDSTVTSGTKYYYMIRPVVTVGGKEYYGPYSNKDYGYPRINALTGFSVWASDYETANISWNKCLDKDAEFWIYRGTKPTGDWGDVYAKVTKNEATSWSETLTPGSKYYYMVREAVKGNDGKYYFGPYTKVDYAYPRLNAPSGFSAWASDKTTCKCSWTKLPGDGIQYLVYRGNAPTGNWGPAIGSTTDGSYTDKGRTTGHKYYYMVRAKVTVNGKTYFGPYTKVDYGYPR